MSERMAHPSGRLRRRLRRAVSTAAIVFTCSAAAPTAHAQPQPAASADTNQKAIELYTEGRKLLSSGKAADALPRLTESLALLPSPNTELLIAHAHRELGHVVVAIRTYAHVADTAAAELAKGQDKYKDALGEAERWKRELGASVGTVVIQGPAGLEVEVRSTTSSDVARAKSGDRVWVDPGDVVVTAASGGRTDAQKVRVAKGATELVTFGDTPRADAGSAPPVESASSSSAVVSIPGIIVGSVGIAALGVSAAFGGMALALHGDLEACRAGQPCAATFEDDKSTGETYKTVTNAMLGVGIGLVAVGATIWIIEAVTSGDEGAPKSAAVGLAPVLDEGGRPAGAVVFGRF